MIILVAHLKFMRDITPQVIPWVMPHALRYIYAAMLWLNIREHANAYVYIDSTLVCILSVVVQNVSTVFPNIPFCPEFS